MLLKELVQEVTRSWTRRDHSLWVGRVIEREADGTAKCQVLEIRRANGSIRLYDGLPPDDQEIPVTICPEEDTRDDWKVFRMDLAYGDDAQTGLLAAMVMFVTDVDEDAAWKRAREQLAKATEDRASKK